MSACKICLGTEIPDDHDCNSSLRSRIAANEKLVVLNEFAAEANLIEGRVEITPLLGAAGRNVQQREAELERVRKGLEAARSIEAKIIERHAGIGKYLSQKVQPKEN